MKRGYVEFEFDLPGSLLRNLIEVIDSTEPETLSIDGLSSVPEEQGVYQLLLNGKVVYVGKTDAEAGLHRRLSRHGRKILHRKNLDPKLVSFKAIRIFVFTAINLETALIKNYGGVSGLEWNGSGFGANDPGRQRDKSRIKADHYDALYPIDIDRDLPFAIDVDERASSVATRLKDTLPYVFRVESADAGGRRPHEDLVRATLSERHGPMSARQAISYLVSTLPKGWQATALPGYLILYKENEVYPQAEIICRS